MDNKIMKRYYTFDDINEAVGGTTYLEAEDGVTFRNLVLDGDRVVSASNMAGPDWGLGLPEGQVDYDSIEEVTPLDQAAFDQVWNRHLASYMERWQSVKHRFPLGLPVEGHILIFYPQGTIVDLHVGALGLADYKACAASTKWQFMAPGHKVTGSVSGYDELNQWVIINNPQVWEEHLPPRYFAGKDG